MCGTLADSLCGCGPGTLGEVAGLGWLCWDACGGGTAFTILAIGYRLTSVTDELAVATKEVLSRQEMVSQLQRELRSEEQSTHPRER